MGLTMTDDGHVRPLRLEDLKEVAERDRRIQQLEAQCVTLAAQVDRMRAITTVAEVIADYGMSTARYTDLQTVIDRYRAAMAQLAGENQQQP